MRPLLSAGVSSFDAGARDRGVEERVLLGKFAKLVSGARDVSDAGGVSSLLPGSDFTGVLEKCSKLDRTSVCCNNRSILALQSGITGGKYGWGVSYFGDKSKSERERDELLIIIINVG